jgi:hypothetical protein
MTTSQFDPAARADRGRRMVEDFMRSPNRSLRNHAPEVLEDMRDHARDCGRPELAQHFSHELASRHRQPSADRVSKCRTPGCSRMVRRVRPDEPDIQSAVWTHFDGRVQCEVPLPSAWPQDD